MSDVELDWMDVWKVEKDIVYLYHHQTEYSGIDGDLAYTYLFNLPYWDYLPLEMEGLDSEEKQFVETGCLILLLCMALDLLEGSGHYLRSYLERCRTAVSRLRPDDPSVARLVQIVQTALDAAGEGQLWGHQREEDLQARLARSRDMVWVNEAFIRGYFRRMAGVEKLSNGSV